MAVFAQHPLRPFLDPNVSLDLLLATGELLPLHQEAAWALLQLPALLSRLHPSAPTLSTRCTAAASSTSLDPCLTAVSVSWLCSEG